VDRKENATNIHIFVTSPSIDLCLKLFHSQTQQLICNKVIVKDHNALNRLEKLPDLRVTEKSGWFTTTFAGFTPQNK